MIDERVVVIPYDPDWPRQFEAERARLTQVLAPWLADDIHHIGSTAVPGLAAKPMIDMMAGVRNLAEARAAFEPLAAQGYVHAPHRPSIAHHFAKPSIQLSAARYSLHLTEPDSDLWRERLAFRDTLRGDDTLAAEYTAVKVRLAQQHTTDLAAYTAGKRELVGRVLAQGGLTFGRR